MASKIPGLIFALLLFQQCFVPNKSFVAPGYEPVTVKQKGDIEISAAMRPFKFYKFNGTYSINNWMAVRAGCSGYINLGMCDVSVLFYKNFKYIGFFAGPTYNYQRNTISWSYSMYMLGVGRSYRYNCEYHSPGAVVGLSLFTSRGSTHQFIFKASNNFVSRYEYYNENFTPSGKSAGYEVKDLERLNYRIRDFASMEPSYSFISKGKIAFRFQFSMNICQTVLRHTYSFLDYPDYGKSTRVNTKLHPVFFPVNVSVGMMFRHRVKKNPAGQ